MIPFKSYLNENATVAVYKGRKIIDTMHSIERFIERAKITKDQIMTIIKRGIDKILGDEYYETAEMYLVYSRSFRQGIVLNYRKEKINIDDKKHFIIETILPPGKHYVKPDTKEVFTESIITESTEVQEYLYGLLDEDITQYEYEEIEKHGVQFIIVDGNIYDLDAEVVEVE